MTESLSALNTNGAAPLLGNLLVDADSLRFMARNEYLPPAAYEKAMLFLGLRPNAKSWTGYWLKILLTAGLLFCVAGAICFFAFNWAAMSHALKFGIIIALMLIGAALALWRGPDALSGGLGLLACGLLAGPLLAVYGQYYQTGADPWNLFLVWTVFATLLAIPGRQNGLWLAAWIVGSICVLLCLHQLYFNGHYFSLLEMTVFWPFMLAQLIVLAVWETCAYKAINRPNSFLHTAWPMRIIGFVALLVLTIACIDNIVIMDSYYRSDSFLPGAPYIDTLLYIILMVGGFCWYRFKRPDTLLVTLGMFSLIALLYVFMLVHLDLFNAGGMLFLAILLLGLAFGITKLALFWHHQALSKAPLTVKTGMPELWRQILFSRTVTLQKLCNHLGQNNANAIATAIAADKNSITPWYIKLLLTICACVAAVFLIAFMGFFIYEISYSDAANYFCLFALIFLFIAAFMVRAKHVFPRQFGLALALAGALVLPVSLVILLEMDSFWQLPILFTAVICFLFIKHPAMRALAFFGILLCLLDLWVVVWVNLNMSPWENKVGRTTLLYYVNMLVTVTAFGTMACCMVNLWVKEKYWIQRPLRDGFLRPALVGLIAMLAFMGLFSAVFGNHTLFNDLWLWEIYYRSAYLTIFARWVGLGTAVGLIYLVRRWFKKRSDIIKLHKHIIYAGAMLTVFIGWWLPWLTIGLFFLALARYIGSLAWAGLSVAYLVACVIWYYYALEISLLYKAYTLLAAGALMLLAGAFVYRLFYVPQTAKGGAHA